VSPGAMRDQGIVNLSERWAEERRFF
jgi:hypothetical protein